MNIQEITYQDSLYAFNKLAHIPGTVFLDGRSDTYSFIGIDPFEIITDDLSNPFELLRLALNTYHLETIPDLPPFQGGMLGFWGYDLCAKFEKINLQALDEFSFPGMIVGFYDLVIAYDHRKKQSWIISSGLPEESVQTRHKRAEKRLNWVCKCLEKKQKIEKNVFKPQSVFSNFTKTEYCHAVEKVKEYILNGDIFETNIAQRFHVTLSHDYSITDLYRRLRMFNKAPFSSFLNFGNHVLASASPERFLRLKSGCVETKPIKGTLPRSKTLAEDKFLANKLLNSEKDKAENIMIVDLMRNDLSKVSLPNSVVVEKLCALESFSSVHHLVSTLHSELLPECSAVDLLEACFPAGSITGAPKVRSMEIISEIEPHRRGAYCGAIGYIGFNGDMDASVTIRTFAANKNNLSFHAGGAIVLDSDPLSEYQETLDKVNTMINILTKEKQELL